MGAKQQSAEQRIIAQLQARAVPGVGVALGVGDDAAVCELPAGRDLLTTTDALVEGTHFLPDAQPRSVGHRALAVNLSDVAAMGGEPLWASLALSLPAIDEHWLDGFIEGFSALAVLHDVALIGGDTVRGARSATVTLQGSVPTGTAVRRSGAQPGDLICVTGFPGDSIAGRLLLSGRLESVAGYADYLRGRFEFPQPRLAAGVYLRGLATAMLDVSDGLHTDIARLLLASGVGAELDLEQLRCSDSLLATVGIEQARDCALLGGEDYELAFTVPPKHAHELAGLAAELELPVTVLGEVNRSAGLTWRLAGKAYVLAGSSFEHFV